MRNWTLLGGIPFGFVALLSQTTNDPTWQAVWLTLGGGWVVLQTVCLVAIVFAMMRRAWP